MDTPKNITWAGTLAPGVAVLVAELARTGSGVDIVRQLEFALTWELDSPLWELPEVPGAGSQCKDARNSGNQFF